MPPRGSRYKTGDAELDELLRQLVDRAGIIVNRDLITESLVSVLRMGRDDTDRGDMKIVNTTLSELRNAYEVFGPDRDHRKAAIFGSARTPRDSPAWVAAHAVGAELSRRGWRVITGGGPGIMTAGVEGAGRENSYGVTIRLPFEPTAGSDAVDDERLVRFRYFFNRKLTFMKESSGYVVMPGGFGTMDETFELLTLLQTGKESPAPVVLFHPPGSAYWHEWVDVVRSQLLPAGYIRESDLELFRITDDPIEAVDDLCDFYRRYHSLRYVDGHLVIRLAEDVSDEQLASVNAEFGDIMVEPLVRTGALDPELRDDDVTQLPRLMMRHDERSFARLIAMCRRLSTIS